MALKIKGIENILSVYISNILISCKKHNFINFNVDILYKIIYLQFNQ